MANYNLLRSSKYRAYLGSLFPLFLMSCTHKKETHSSDTIERLLPIQPRMDESIFLERVKQEGWECFKQPATELDEHLPDDLSYTCKISTDIGFGKFTTLQLVTRAKATGGRWVMPVLSYVSLQSKTTEECEALAITAANLLQKSWPTQLKRDTEMVGAIGAKENENSIEFMTIGCGNGRSGLNWMYHEKKTPAQNDNTDNNIKALDKETQEKIKELQERLDRESKRNTKSMKKVHKPDRSSDDDSIL